MPVPSFAASNMSPTPGPGHGCSYRRGQWPAPARRRSWHVMCINKHSALYSHAPSTDRQTVSRIAQRASLVRQRWSKSAYPRIPVTIDQSLRPSENVATRCIERFRGRISLHAFSGATWRRTKGTFLAPSCERRCGRG